MTTTEQFVRGLKVAGEMTDVTKTQACKDSGVDYSTLWRFMNKGKDIKLSTLCRLCETGYQMSLTKVLVLGEKPAKGNRNEH